MGVGHRSAEFQSQCSAVAGFVSTGDFYLLFGAFYCTNRTKQAERVASFEHADGQSSNFLNFAGPDRFPQLRQSVLQHAFLAEISLLERLGRRRFAAISWIGRRFSGSTSSGISSIAPPEVTPSYARMASFGLPSPTSSGTSNGPPGKQTAFYVAISRARHNAELVTDDANKLANQLQRETGERLTALDAAAEKVAREVVFGKEADAKSNDKDAAYGDLFEPMTIPTRERFREKSAESKQESHGKDHDFGL